MRLVQEWFTAAELACRTLPDLPASPRGIAFKAEREAWTKPEQRGTWWRERTGRGGGIEYHLSVLPQAAQVKLCIDLTLEKPTAVAPAHALNGADRSDRWQWFDRQTDKKKSVASTRLAALQAVRSLTDAGVAKTVAMRQVAEHNKVAQSSLYEWEKLVHRVPVADWLPYLSPRHAGSAGARVEFCDEAWEALKADWLRQSEPSVADCYRRLFADRELQTPLHGWTVPSLKTCERRLMAIPETVRVLRRKGADAVATLYPPQRRDRSDLHAMQVLNADFHTWDVRVLYPDGTITRPVMAAFQDIQSGKVLAWRVDFSPTRDGVRLCFGEVMERYGIPPEIIFDNGREFAAKEITGGQKTRHRFKIKDEDPVGLMTQLGVNVRFTNVYHGQAKPIERAFRDMAGSIAKDPRFEGAYVGNSPVNKPGNYGEKAVPLALFVQVINEGIAEHNGRLGRTGGICDGRSFDQVFAESYAVSTIRKATAEQRRLCLLATESIKTARINGSIEILGNRFWHEDLVETRGARVTVRFDPMNVQAGVHVYRADGAYLCEAPCIADSGFMNRDDARETGRKSKAFVRAAKALDAATSKMSLKQRLKFLQPLPDAPPLSEPKVVQLVWGNTARQLAPETELEEQSPAEAAYVAATSRARLRVVTNGDD